jgi:hypothetical protein
VADALGTLWRLRRLHSEEARRTLAAALAAEAEAANRLKSALAAPAREAAALGRQPSRQMTNAYAAWLPAAARAMHSCRRAGEAAGKVTTAAAAALGERMAEEKAVALLLDQLRLAERKQQEKRAQLRLDDFAQSRR